MNYYHKPKYYPQKVEGTIEMPIFTESAIYKNNRYKQMLNILNFGLKLSDLEIDIISTLLNKGISVINTESREMLRLSLNKDKFITNNYIVRLKDKGILIPNKNTKDLILDPGLLKTVKDNKVSFELIIGE